MNRCSPLATRAIRALAVLGLLASLVYSPAFAQTRPALTNDVSNLGRQPVQLHFSEAINPGQTRSSSGAVLYTVPASKRLVVDWVYTRAIAPQGQGIEAWVDGYSFLFQPQWPLGITTDWVYQSYTSAYMVFGPGETVDVITNRNVTAGTAFLTIRINGHLVDI